MGVIDSHAHTSELWYEPVETLSAIMGNHYVDRAILIPYGGNYIEDRYELACARQFPEKFAAVVQVDLKQPEALDSLDVLVKKGASGIRLRPGEYCPGADPLAVWRKANALGLAVSSLGSIDTYSSGDFITILEKFTDLKIVLEHLGGAARTKSNPEPNYPMFGNVLALAKYPNVYIKLPGFGEFTPRPYPMKNPAFDQTPSVIKMVYDAFGPQRMMWGSDFPNCSTREGYRNALQYPMKIHYFSDEDRKWIFEKTALSVFWKK